ncbi:MAG: TonB-dependent receptor [Chitinophagaceae bacterium]|nr:TonB-dependent receptor [Chitinophagaceae bacterium]
MKTFIYSIALSLIFVAGIFKLNAQQKNEIDTIPVKVLDSILVNSYLPNKGVLPETQGSFLFSGKKSEVISLTLTDADMSSKIARQLFAKVPGVFVYDMDGAGNQINIATRGLDPHRGWDFNIRKDGILTNSDMYGYPASHYNMPMESIDKIELVRGTGSLQYGAQFGGMLSYVTKKADSTKPFSFESINTIGSYNLLSTYNAIGGTIGKLKYYAYINRKSRDGYRQWEHTNAEAEDLILSYEPNQKISFRFEWARSAYTYRMPGPLSDIMFYADPQKASRTRNYFNPDIHVPSLTFNWQINKDTKIQFTSSAVLGNRNSVMFDKPTNINDTINAATMQYNNRQVDIDAFHSYTSELRLLQNYSTGNLHHVLVAGIQYMNNDLHRRQLGKGTTGSDFNLTLVDPAWGRDLDFKTKNLALFIENKFQVLPGFSITSGVRAEKGQSNMSGTINYYPNQKIPLQIEHQFPLFGAGFTYQVNDKTQVYGGWAQSYRPMIFKDLIPASTYEQVDAAIKDAHGDNSELGYRGSWKFLKWDITAFLLREYNRFGTLAETDANGALYTYRTNIGNSINRGIEIFIQADWHAGRKSSFSAFTSTAFMKARYTDAIVKKGNANIDITGNKVESAPDFTSRNGLTYRYANMSISALYSYTSETFADALNTVLPTPGTGAVGLVPAYGLFDLNSSFKLSSRVELRANLSNLTNKQYFTKRPLFYPGPGIWPSEGRNFSVSVGIKL